MFKCVASSVSWQSLHAYYSVLILAAQSTISASVRGSCSITLNLVLSVGIFIMGIDHKRVIVQSIYANCI